MHLNACQPPPNTGMQRTALCARKIGAFLKVGISWTPVPIYGCAAADAQTVSRHRPLKQGMISPKLSILLSEVQNEEGRPG